MDTNETKGTQAVPSVPDASLRSRVADLLHLMQFAQISCPSEGDDEQVRLAMKDIGAMLAAAPKPVEMPAQHTWPSTHTAFSLGDRVRKTKGSQWNGRVVGWYSTELTPEGYAVESTTERGSVQIYPASALEAWEAPKPEGA